MNTTSDPAGERAQARRDALALTIAGPLVTAVLIAVWALTGTGYFWPIWPLLGMTIALLVGLWRAFGPLPEPQTAGAAGAAESRPEPM
jgi:hypothetical protein